MGRRPRHSTAETRRAICDAASGLFMTVGFSKTSMADVAAAAGMSSANVYKHFPNKMAILDALAEDHFREVERDLGPLDPTRPVAEQILADVLFLAARFRIDSTPQMLDVFASTLFEAPPVVRAFRGRLVARFAAVLAAGIARGELATRDPIATAHTLVDALECLIDAPLLLRRLHAQPDLDVPAMANRLVDLVVNGLRAAT